MRPVPARVRPRGGREAPGAQALRPRAGSRGPEAEGPAADPGGQGRDRSRLTAALSALRSTLRLRFGAQIHMPLSADLLAIRRTPTLNGTMAYSESRRS